MPRRATSTSFKPGQSGNPGGRPGGRTGIQEIARSHTEDAIQALVEIVGNKKAPAAARVSAASALLDRGYGKPAQTLNAFVTKSHEEWLAELEDRGEQGVAENGADRD